MRRHPVRVGACQRIEDRERRRRVAARAVRGAENDRGDGIAGRDLEHLVGLFGGKRRIGRQQLRGVCQRDLEGTNRLLRAAHASDSFFDSAGGE